MSWFDFSNIRLPEIKWPWSTTTEQQTGEPLVNNPSGTLPGNDIDGTGGSRKKRRTKTRRAAKKSRKSRQRRT